MALGVGQGQALTPLFPLQFVLKNYGENPENYNEELRKLELLRQVSRALTRMARSPGETCQSRTRGAGLSPALRSRRCLPAPTTSLDQELCRSAAATAAFPHQGLTDEAFGNRAASWAPQTIQASQGVCRGWALGLCCIRFPEFGGFCVEYNFPIGRKESLCLVGLVPEVFAGNNKSALCSQLWSPNTCVSHWGHQSGGH